MLSLLLCNEEGRRWIKFNLQQCEVLLLETLLKGFRVSGSECFRTVIMFVFTVQFYSLLTEKTDTYSDVDIQQHDRKQQE